MDQERRDVDDKKASQDDKFERWIKSIEIELGAVDYAYIQEYSISIVPDQLKQWNEDAYMPKVVSIGLLYRGTRRDLLYMEEIKLRCMLSLFHRLPEKDLSKSLKDCGKAILRLDKVVRASYLSDIKLDEYELANTMLLDGCFLLELLITGSDMLKDSIPKSLLEPPHIGKMEKVLSDLTLLENQIPIVILHELSTLLFPVVFTYNENDRIKKINDLALSLLGYSEVSNPGYSPVSNPNASHFLELVHSSISGNGKKVEPSQDQSKYLSESSGHGKKVVEIQESQHSSIVVKSEQVEESTRLELKLKRCATRLQAAGITIKPLDSDSDPSDRQGNCFGRMLIRLVNMLVFFLLKVKKILVGRGEESKHAKKHAVKGSRFDLNIRFSKREGKLEILPLHITETTKAKWLNFLAWEHHRTNWMSSSTTNLGFKFTSSALVFNGLICCAADVQLLTDRKVIVDHLKMSKKELMNFFQTISMGVDHSIVDSSYIELCDDLNKYSAVYYPIQIPIILWHYIRWFLEWLFKFLKRDYNLVATVIPILTIAQTIFAVLSYLNDKK